jgi:hypothetical protein
MPRRLLPAWHSLDQGCPEDLPGAPLPERDAHLYACQMLSTYKIAVVTGVDRQAITGLLHKAGSRPGPAARAGA